MASILSIVVVIFYFELRFDILMNYKDTTYHSTRKPNPDINSELNLADADFSFAFGVQQFDNALNPLKYVDHRGYIEIDLFLETDTYFEYS